jgi:hypothetical protein
MPVRRNETQAMMHEQNAASLKKAVVYFTLGLDRLTVRAKKKKCGTAQ